MGLRAGRGAQGPALSWESSALLSSALLHSGILFPNAAGSFAPEKNVFAIVGVVTHQHGLLREVAVTPRSEHSKPPGNLP